MASMKIKNIGPAKVHFRDACSEFELVEVELIDARGRRNKANFIKDDLLNALLMDYSKNGETVIDSIFTAADQKELVR